MTVFSLNYVRRAAAPAALVLAFGAITALKIWPLLRAASSVEVVTLYHPMCSPDGASVELTVDSAAAPGGTLRGELVQEGPDQRGAAAVFARSEGATNRYSAPVPAGFGGRMRLLIAGESVPVEGKCRAPLKTP